MDPIENLYEYLEKEEATRVERWRPPQDLRFRPSELGGCLRALYYRLAGNRPRPLRADTKLMFLDGDVQHNVIRQMMREAGAVLGDLTFEEDGGVEETGASKRTISINHGGKDYDVTLSGRNDGLVEIDGRMVLLEIKTVGGYKFQQFQYAYERKGAAGVIKLLQDDVKKRAGARPHPRHANRRFWYQFQGTMLLRDAPELYVVIKNRDGCEVGLKAAGATRGSGVLVPADPDVQDTILHRCASVLAALDVQQAPMAEFMDGSRTCLNCDFYNLCWGKMHADQVSVAAV